MTSQQTQPKQPQLDPAANELYVKIMNAEKIVYEGKASAVTSWNEKGTFDILPYHANFVAIIKKFITIHGLDKKKTEIKIDMGILKIASNVVQIFLGIQVETPITMGDIMEQDKLEEDEKKPHKKREETEGEQPIKIMPPPITDAKKSALYGG